MTNRISLIPFPHIVALVAALALSFTFIPPRAAKADPGEAVAAGIIGLAVFCGVTGKCTSRGGGARGGGGGGGPVDAIRLTGQNAMLVQGGLQTLGYYTGAIDGAIGSGTRGAIRQYQAAIGANQTGVLTGQQINDLAALSPAYVNYSASDARLFAADLATDLERDGLRQLQSALNAQGFPAGAVDGSFGNQTRTAIRAYKAANGLPGAPVASRRLLAKLMGYTAPEPMGKQFVTAGAGYGAASAALAPVPAAPALPQASVVIPQAVAPVPSTQTASRAPEPAPPVPSVDILRNSATAAPQAAAPRVVVPAARSSDDLGFDILGVELGMSEAQVKGTLMAQLGGQLMFDTTEAASIGAGEAATRAFLTVQPDWPEPPAEQILTLFDETRPELGALAVFRMIRMPDTVDRAVFDTQVLPDIVANYGEAGKVPGETLWIGRAAARVAGAACGDPRLSVDASVATALDALWRSGGGPRLDGLDGFDGLDGATAACGQVLKVDFAGSVVRIGLWDPAAFAGGAAEAAPAAPKIKF